MKRKSMSKRKRRGQRRAAKADLIYVNAFDRGYSRRRCGGGFTYLSTRGNTLKSSRVRKRFRALAIPPAWQDVWICPKARGHIQAKGRDEDDRLQYIYHDRWIAVSAAVKYSRMALMAEVLPRIRRRVRRDLSKRQASKRGVLAAVVRLIDRAAIRVGNADYTDSNGSRGVTTLAKEHVTIDGVLISLAFPGKSGKQRRLTLKDRKVAQVINHCEEIDGQFLFSFRGKDGDNEAVNSSDVNDYLRDASQDTITAKDFRTWTGSVCALAFLADEPLSDQPAARRQRVREAVAAAAQMLGNTMAVCRSSYIHPAILTAGETGELGDLLKKAAGLVEDAPVRELTTDERLFAALVSLQ